MMTGRGPLGKLVMVIFILFNLVMLCLAGLAHKIKTAPAEELRANLMAKVVELGKETRDDRTLNSREMADLEETVNDIMELFLYVQAKGVQGVLIMWAIGAVVIGVLLYYTRPQPI